MGGILGEHWQSWKDLSGALDCEGDLLWHHIPFYHLRPLIQEPIEFPSHGKGVCEGSHTLQKEVNEMLGTSSSVFTHFHFSWGGVLMMSPNVIKCWLPH